MLANSRPGETDDLSDLSALDEATLLEELSIRYSQDKIYVSGQLVAEADNRMTLLLLPYHTDLCWGYTGGSESFQEHSHLFTRG
jgi:myosin heavy subunit